MSNDSKPFDLNDVPVYVDNVHIRGLKKTKEIYVKNALNNIFESKNFNEIVIKSEELRQKFYALGCFKSIDLLIDSSKNIKNKNSFDVFYDVEEPLWIGGGIQTTVGNNEGALSGNINLPNLFGKGESGKFEYTYGTRHNSDYRVTFQSPINMNPNKIFSISAFQGMNEFSWNKFKEKNLGFNMNITTPFCYEIKKNLFLNGRHNFQFEGVWRNLISFSDSAIETREQSGHSLKSALKYSFIIDKRTNMVLPKDGGYLNTSFELSGIGGDVKYFKINQDYQYSKQFFKYLIGQITFSSGCMVPWGEDKSIRISDRFFLGGPLSLRGFTTRGAGPQRDECAIGNDAFWLLGLHLYTPLPFFHKEEKLSSWLKTHTFLNMGNIFSVKNLKSLQENRLEYLKAEARLSVGTGLVIKFGNIARLELNYVLPLWKQQNDRFVNGLQFGIGLAFN